MKCNTWIILLIVIQTGCAPLQQAPLAYTSKVAWGLDISSTTTETPGISMVVGYKAVDAAYVPVAVSKKCVAGSECTNDTYKLVKLDGHSDEQLSNLNKAAEKELELKSLQKNLEAIEISNIAKIEALRIEINKLSEKKAELESSGNATEEELSSIFQSIATNDTEITKARNETTAAQERVKKLSNEIELANTDKNLVSNSDAYSVYGRFESSADAEAAKMGFGIGKIFSTGVASQHLTRGLANSYKATADSRKECYLTAQFAIKEKQHQNVIDSILKGCKAIN